MDCQVTTYHVLGANRPGTGEKLAESLNQTTKAAPAIGFRVWEFHDLTKTRLISPLQSNNPESGHALPASILTAA